MLLKPFDAKTPKAKIDTEFTANAEAASMRGF
jgi:hypothetical protein